MRTKLTFFKVAYKAFIENQTEPFDVNELSFQIGCAAIPFGLSWAIKSMVVGEKSVFTIPPQLIYTTIESNNKSDPIKIPMPQNSIVYDIELLDWNRPLTMDSGVSKIKTLVKGNDKKCSTIYDTTCVISYSLKYADGTVEEFSRKEIILGVTPLFWGIEIALWSMHEEEKSEYLIEERYLVIRDDEKAKATPKQSVEIHLHKLTVDIPESPSKKRDLVKTFTKRGITLREKKRYSEAIEHFDKASEVLSEIKFESTEHVLKLSLEATLFVNKNMSLMEMQQFVIIIENADTILAKYPKFLDALWIRGRAQGKLGLLEKARTDFEKILEICNEEEEQWVIRKRKMKELSAQLNLAFESAQKRLKKAEKMKRLLEREKSPDQSAIKHNLEEQEKTKEIMNGLLKQIEDLKVRTEKEKKDFEKTQKADQTLRTSVEIELSKLYIPILYDYFIHQNQNMVSYMRLFDQSPDTETNLISQFIIEHTPSAYNIKSGEIWDSYGSKSDFFKHIIVKNNCPTLGRSSNIVLFESASCIIEIVSVLTLDVLNHFNEKFSIFTAMNKDGNDDPLLPLKIVFTTRCETLNLNDIKECCGDMNAIDAVLVLEDGVVFTSSKTLPFKKNEVEYGKGLALKYLWLSLSTLSKSSRNWPQSYIQGNWPRNISANEL